MTELLQEFFDARGVRMRVDRQAGVVRGVKILGLQSRNGRTYLPEALAQAAPLYEGAKVNVNHPKGNPGGPRDYQDRMGVIREVAVRDDGLFADFHFNPKHALAEQLLWDAEHAPENVGFSHNVEARTVPPRRDRGRRGHHPRTECGPGGRSGHYAGTVRVGRAAATPAAAPDAGPAADAGIAPAGPSPVGRSHLCRAGGRTRPPARGSGPAARGGIAPGAAGVGASTAPRVPLAGGRHRRSTGRGRGQPAVHRDVAGRADVAAMRELVAERAESGPLPGRRRAAPASGSRSRAINTWPTAPGRRRPGFRRGDYLKGFRGFGDFGIQGLNPAIPGLQP